MSVNKVILVGNVGKDPDVKHLENDLSVAHFSLATTERFKDKSGNKIERTEWHNIVVWRGLARVVEDYVRKGQQLYIEGRIQTRKYQDKDGNDKYSTDIVADNLQMLGKKSSDNTAPASQGNVSQANESTNTSYGSPETDDLPF